MEINFPGQEQVESEAELTEEQVDAMNAAIKEAQKRKRVEINGVGISNQN